MPSPTPAARTASRTWSVTSTSSSRRLVVTRSVLTGPIVGSGGGPQSGAVDGSAAAGGGRLPRLVERARRPLRRAQPPVREDPVLRRRLDHVLARRWRAATGPG